MISLEEGEIRTDDEALCIDTLATKSEAKDNEHDDDDDCVVIEPNIDEITIEDENENEEFPLSNNVCNNYQSLVHSFKERVSSTPYHKRKDNAEKYTESDEESPPYFVDILGRRSGIESINSTDTFSEYIKFGSALGDKSVSKQRREHLKEKDCEEIIELDDFQHSEQNSTLKRKCSYGNNHGKDDDEDDDESVIFVSETNQNDFISIKDSQLHSPYKVNNCQY